MASSPGFSFSMEGDQDIDIGTGAGFGRLVLILAGVSSLIAIVITLISAILQAKNYRKPLLQRHVIRIFILVPIFAAASWASLTSLRVAFWVEPFRDIYEAFTIYTFFQLLVNFLGGERSLIIMMHGRQPKAHLWPMNKLFGTVDISDPHTFLSIKRGILQYVWIKPALSIATIAMKATGTFKDGIISWESGYFWTALIYNVSIGWCLYDLALFWVCMSADLQPFRPMPKFLCIKGIIFASWWQGFFLSILVFLGAIPHFGGGYTADNVAVAIQDALICFEMPLFAIAHWYAFSWTDYADRTISDARMPMRYAFRDCFGPRDLIEDAKETWSGQQYEYRYFDAEDNVIAHEASASRRARMREGMRFERDGRGKYWLPSADGANAKQPLLSRMADSHARTMSPGNGESRSQNQSKGYGGTSVEPEEPELDAEEETLYKNAKALEFGDWNYPVINTHYATREDGLRADPGFITASTNRALFQPTKDNKQRRKSRIKEIKEDVHQAESSSSHHPGSSSSGNTSPSLMGKGKEKLQSVPVIGPILERAMSSGSSSNKSHSSQLVDLIVEDHQAEEVERVRARKEGGPGWNTVEQKHFVHTFPDEPEGEDVRQGFNPDNPEGDTDDEQHNLITPLDKPQHPSDMEGLDQTGSRQPWEERNYDGTRGAFDDEERNAWGR